MTQQGTLPRPARQNAAAGHDPAAKSGRKSTFRPEIQGLRSLAVLMVMTYHIWLGRVSGGVDVFLLISAFLMTLQFVGRYEQGRSMALIKHWLHLFRRLVPAAVTVLVAILAATVLFLPRTRWMEIINQGWASLGYAENWLLQTQATNYYAADHSQASPFQHFWSLSIQGQVFILWPLIFVGAAVVARRFRLRYRVLLCYIFAVIFVVSLLYSIVFTQASQTEAYFDTWARLWEFALGTLVALALPALRLPRAWRVGLGWLGIVAMLSCGLLLNVQASFPGFVALWPTLAAACVIAAGQSGSKLGVDRILSSKPLVRLGDISYALYLWHWPVLVIALAVMHREKAGLITGAVIVTVSLVLAYLTTRFIEKPWREWQWPEVRRRRALVAIGLAVVTAAVPLAGIQIQQHLESEAVLAQAPKNNPGALALTPGFVDQADANAVLLPTPQTLPQDWASLPNSCSGDLQPQDPVLQKDCFQNNQSDTGAKKVLVIGDSHAQQWLGSIAPLSDEKGWRLYAMLKGACKPNIAPQHVSADCDNFNAAVASEVKNNPPDAIIIVGTEAAPSSPQETVIPGFEATAKAWTDEGIKVVALRDNPRFTFNMAECVATKGADAPDCRPREQGLLAATNPLAALEAKLPGVAFVDMTDLICTGTECPGAVGNTYVYLDNNHLSRSYAASMAPMFSERLLAATGWGP